MGNDLYQKIKYVPSKTAHAVLIKGNIIAPGETPQHMFQRVVETIFSVEAVFGTDPADTLKAKEKFARFLADKMYTPGTPTLTNAGRVGYEHAALSSCAIIPANLRDRTASEKMIKAYYRQNMGSGFDLTEYENPIELLLWLNDMAVKETEAKKYDRYIGNMANLHISHPAIEEFISLKRNRRLMHFNCSVIVDNEFMDAAIAGKNYTMLDGSKRNAKELLWKIAESSWHIGDPSIINLERMNADNPIADLMPYVSAPPCAEMGLSVGETCQFNYVNISKFCTPQGIDYDLLRDVITLVVRSLDDSVEYGLARYPSEVSSEVARMKRKIGIAVSGIADTLLYFGYSYGSPESVKLVRNVVSFVNFVSKQASHELALIRGSCGAMSHPKENLYYRDYLKKRYDFSTDTVSAEDWAELSDRIKNTGALRNILTVIQPPAARVSLLMDCSFGIEPIFGIPSDPKEISASVVDYVKKAAGDSAEAILVQASREGSFRNTTLSSMAKRCLRTATELSPEEHIEMVAALVGKHGVIDETASKTVNLAKTCTVQDVFDILVLAYRKGMKNISVYRDGSYEDQPYKLTK